jgi:UPF0271 protein
MRVDLNADLGEGCPFDAQIMRLVTSANVACGAHAGDPATMAKALGLARDHGVQVGAHPGYFDREHFGRRELERDEEAVYLDCVYQVAALRGLAELAGVSVRYVKPHGALYNQACRDEAYARPVVRAARHWALSVMGLPDSALARAAAAAGVPFIPEGFADRRYRPDGSLVPRTEPDAFVASAEEAARQAEWLLAERGVLTICVHGDNPDALAFIAELRRHLASRGWTVAAFGS